MYAVGPNKTPQKRTLQFGEPDSRYQTLQLQLHYVGKNKMVRTGFLNVCHVARTMMIPEAWLIAFLGYTLKTKVFEKEGNLWLAGRYEPAIVSEKVVDFIHMVLLCERCAKPELTWMRQKGRTGYKCRSCGHCIKKTYKPDKFQKYLQESLGESFRGRKHKKRRPVEMVEGDIEDVTPSFCVDTSDSAVEARRKAAHLPSLFQEERSEEDIDELLDAL